jgi:hypothetical protein
VTDEELLESTLQFQQKALRSGALVAAVELHKMWAKARGYPPNADAVKVTAQDLLDWIETGET